MSIINKKLVGLQYSGPAVALSTAPFKSSIGLMYGFNSAGTGYTSFNPASAFNSLNGLAPTGTYILLSSAAAPSWNLPGAVLQAGSAVSGPGSMTLGYFTLNDLNRTINLRVNTNYPGDAHLLLYFVQEDDIIFEITPNVDYEIPFNDFGGPGTYRVVNSRGNTLDIPIAFTE